MKINLTIDHLDYSVDLADGTSIAISLVPDGEQPNHFGAQKCTSKTLVDDNFIGDTRQGGSCNVNQLTIIPHCNGTHTESISHIIDQQIPVFNAIEQSFFCCLLISIAPCESSQTTDSYLPSLSQNNSSDKNNVITRKQLEQQLNNYSDSQLHGLAIRTLANLSSKKSQVYDAEYNPPFLSNDAMAYISERNVRHLMVDFPSVDKMYDEGKLSNHRIFWNVELGKTESKPDSQLKRTITEMIFAPNELPDGLYLCNLQVPQIETDAVPSRPILYPITKS
jgi:kynurenine formamidase